MKFCSDLIDFLAFLLNELFCNDEIFVAVFSCAAIQLCVFCTSDKNYFFTKTNKWYGSTDTTLYQANAACGFAISVWSKFTIKFFVFFCLSGRHTIVEFLSLAFAFQLKIDYIVEFSASTQNFMEFRIQLKIDPISQSISSRCIVHCWRTIWDYFFREMKRFFQEFFLTFLFAHTLYLSVITVRFLQPKLIKLLTKEILLKIHGIRLHGIVIGTFTRLQTWTECGSDSAW